MKITDERPALFRKSDHTIWTDPHIQRQLLKKPLDLQSDEASRNRESILKIVDFVDRHADSPGRLLDLGCGPGLYTSLFADRGYRVTGIDFNAASIEYAAVGNRKGIDYIAGNYVTDFPAGQYDVITMIYCDLGTHPDRDRDWLLANVYRSLPDSGIFVFDVFPEELAGERAEGKSWEYAPSGGFWDEGEYLLLSQTFHYPEDRVFAYQYNLMLRDSVKHFIVWEKYYTEDGITELLKQVGFRKITVYRDLLGRNDFTSGSEMFIVAEK